MVKGTEAVTEYQPLLSDSHMKLPSKSLLLAICAVGIGGTFQCGYNISIMNAPTKSIQNFINQTWLGRYETDIPEHTLTLLWSIIVSIFTLGGLIGASFGGNLAIKLGRKGALLINNTFSLLAALLMGLSYPTGLYELLIVGRFLTGINAGISMCVQPLYLGEIAPRAFRGAVAMGTSIFITSGILVGQVIGLKELLGRDDLWPVLLSTTSIPAVMQLLILPWFPESPRYLLIERDDSDACTNALRRLHGQEDYRAEQEDMERERISSQGQEPMSPWQLFRDPTLRWQLTTSVLLNAAQQLNGINAIYFYASYVFGQSGIPASKIPYVTLGTGAWHAHRIPRKESVDHRGLLTDDLLVCLFNLDADFTGHQPRGALPKHGLCLRFYSELWSGTRRCDQHPKWRAIHPDLASSCLHDWRFHQLDELIHYRHFVPIHCGWPEAVLLPCVLGHMLLGGDIHILHGPRNQEQNLPGNTS
ncbi:solute carrier family 2, facilitated glucose transporter member 11b isoform X2 [Paramormyrops kingsleyae]|uniref:solute carrier family 2, facilitated glucose transporter member 11b isoform X2 n=1 Tax=Paramormyrops kingsleyae TaxID=1676925 RepID=UPI000CD5E6CE|nr:solute carrier family 2, facilitated glucose transporter member 11-like isoform X2 [Paramormyrops kingsleyae]